MKKHDFRNRLRAFASPAVRAAVPAPAVEGTVAVIRLYDPVDSWGEDWGTSAKEFVAALDDLPDTVDEIRLHINSPGGEVFEGIALLNALRNHPARIVAVVDGLAASAASFIACGADEVVMARNSEMMIHDAWGLCVGNAQDMRDLAEDLDRLSNNIASIYADKAGGDIADWREAMSRETWYSAEEAVEVGLADRVDTKQADAQNAFDLSIFKYAGRRAAPNPTVAASAATPKLTAMNPEVQAAAPAAAEPPADMTVAKARAAASAAAADLALLT